MAIQLTRQQRAALRDALRECLEIAHTYRETVADEDSIVLLKDLEQIRAILDIHVAPRPLQG